MKPPKNRIQTILCLAIGLMTFFANSCKKEEAIIKKFPLISWAKPADITEGTLLSATQLNATADVAGSFVYTPPIGTCLTVGRNQHLIVDFIPTDLTNYKLVSKFVSINVIADVSQQMVNIPAGTFTMGSPIEEVDRDYDETQHEVTLSAFRMSKYEITNAQYAIFLNAKSIDSSGLYAAGAYPTEVLIISGYSDGLIYSDSQWVPAVGYENNPIINVSWFGATEFATYVGGTLPTEAQWEYACRAGTTTPFNTGDFLTNLQANYDWAYPYNGGTNTVTTCPDRTQAVGFYSSNAFGLHEMHGNVWEWCNDWYGSYPTTVQTNPTGPTTGLFRVIRGGSCYNQAQHCRSAERHYGAPYDHYGNVGFRVVLVP